MRYCDECGNELAENSNFCPNCGKKIEKNLTIQKLLVKIANYC